MEAMKPTIKTGDVSPDRPVKVISIENGGVILGFGENFETKQKVTFSDCEVLWGL